MKKSKTARVEPSNGCIYEVNMEKDFEEEETTGPFIRETAPLDMSDALMGALLREDAQDTDLENNGDHDRAHKCSTACPRVIHLFRILRSVSPSSAAPSATSVNTGLSRDQKRALYRNKDAAQVAKKRKRDEDRFQGFVAKRMADADAIAHRSFDLANQPTRLWIEGLLKPRAPQITSVRIIRAGPGPFHLAAYIKDAKGRCMVYRAFGIKHLVSANELLWEAALAADQTLPAQHVRGSAYQLARGGATHDMRLFTIHQTYRTHVDYNKYFLDNWSGGLKLAEDMLPITKTVNDVFRRQFPQHYEFHRKVTQFLADKHQIYTPFGVFTSFALNSGGYVCMEDHTDPFNFPGSLCCVVPWGNVNYRRSALLIIKIGSTEYRFELPEGIPIFFPSAIFFHSNSRIVGDDEYRGSAVYWMAGSVARWYLLNGRSVGSLSSAERDQWKSLESIMQRRDEFLAWYPIVQVA